METGPPDNGSPTMVSNRFNRWSRRGFWLRLLDALVQTGADKTSSFQRRLGYFLGSLAEAEMCSRACTVIVALRVTVHPKRRSSAKLLRKIGAPGAIRTPDPQIRSLMLYPAELRALGKGAS